MVFKDQAIWKETDWSVILHRYHIKTLAKEGKSKILSRCYKMDCVSKILPSSSEWILLCQAKEQNLNYFLNPNLFKVIQNWVLYIFMLGKGLEPL